MADGAGDVLRVLGAPGGGTRRRVGEAARKRVPAGHMAAHRVEELEGYVRQVRS